MSPSEDGSSFTLHRIQAMLGLSRHNLSGPIAAGLVTPTREKRNELRFTYQDLMLLRTAHALQGQKIPPRRIVQSLARLRAVLPAELPLTGLRITLVGADVAVRDRRLEIAAIVQVRGREAWPIGHDAASRYRAAPQHRHCACAVIGAARAVGRLKGEGPKCMKLSAT